MNNVAKLKQQNRASLPQHKSVVLSPNKPLKVQVGKGKDYQESFTYSPTSKKAQVIDFGKLLNEGKKSSLPPVPLPPLLEDDPFSDSPLMGGSQSTLHTDSSSPGISRVGSFQSSSDKGVVLSSSPNTARQMTLALAIADSEERVDKEGWLTKEGRRLHSWKKRWFVLKGTTLAYYTATNKKHKGTINLAGSSEMPTLKLKEHNKEIVELTIPAASSQNRRVLCFTAETESERDAWLIAIGNKISRIKYEKTMKEKGVKCDLLVLQFLSSPDATRLHMCDDYTGSLVAPAIAAVSHSLPHVHALTTLTLSDKLMGDANLAVLCEGLAGNNSITHVDLQNNDIRFEGARSLAAALVENTALTSINLSDNKIDDQGITEIANSLRKHKNIQVLTLNHNLIGDIGCLNLANVINEEELRMPVLDLAHNSIGNDGACVIALLVANNPHIANINLGYNKIGNEGVKPLASQLNYNKTVMVLNLEHNQIGYQGALDLTEMINSNTTIEEVILGGNRLGEKALEMLASTYFDFPVLELSK